MDEIRQKEFEATRLIQEERFDEAVGILEEILRHDINNVNAWWLIANAVDAPDEAREALNMVLKLNPNHAKARQMLDRLNSLYPEAPGGAPAEAPTATIEPTEPLPTAVAPETVTAEPVAETIAEPSEEDFFEFPDESPAAVLAQENIFDFESSPFDRPEAEATRIAETESPAPATQLDESLFDFDEADEALFASLEASGEEPGFDVEAEARPAEDFEFEVEEEAAPRGGGRRILQFLLALTIIVIVSAVVAVVILNRGSGAPPGPPTPTIDAALTALNENHAGALTKTDAALRNAGFNETAASFRETPAGPGMIAIFCWAGGPGFSDAALDAMSIVTEQAQAIPEGLEAVGVELVRCDKLDDVLYSAVTPLGQANDFFIDQDSEEAAFRATWITGP